MGLLQSTRVYVGHGRLCDLEGTYTQAAMFPATHPATPAQRLLGWLSEGSDSARRHGHPHPPAQALPKAPIQVYLINPPGGTPCPDLSGSLDLFPAVNLLAGLTKTPHHRPRPLSHSVTSQQLVWVLSSGSWTCVHGVCSGLWLCMWLHVLIHNSRGAQDACLHRAGYCRVFVTQHPKLG